MMTTYNKGIRTEAAANTILAESAKQNTLRVGAHFAKPVPVRKPKAKKGFSLFTSIYLFKK